MAKRRESGIDVVASMSWPVGLGLGLIAFIGIRYGIGWLLSVSGNPLLSLAGSQAASGIYAPFAWIAMLGCCIGALVSFLKRRGRRHLLTSQTGLGSLGAMSWQEFEQLAGEAFRRQGYAVEETGQGGADGGIDLVLRKGGMTTLVQCKQWRSQQVGVKIVREMFGLLVDQGADAVKIVALGEYTPDAQRFARGKPIELMDGRTLLATVMKIQARTESEVALDKPVYFAAGVLTCLLIALILSPQSAQRLTAPAAHVEVSAPGTPAQLPALPIAPLRPMAVPATATVATQHAAATNQKIYQADTPLSGEELRAWEKKNRESMKILEKTTPELETN
jgi:restriction system protein